MHGLLSWPFRCIAGAWVWLTCDECLRSRCTNPAEPGFTICHDHLLEVTGEAARNAAVRGGRV